MTQHPSGIWYFRYQLPKPIRKFYANKHEFKRSLRTKSYEDAVIMALQYELKVKREISLIKERYKSLDDIGDLNEYDIDVLEDLLKIRTLTDENIYNYNAIREFDVLYSNPLNKALNELKNNNRYIAAQQCRISISNGSELDSILLIKDVLPDYLDPDKLIEKYLKQLTFFVGDDKDNSIEFEEIRNVLTTYFLLLKIAREALEKLDIEKAEQCKIAIDALAEKVKNHQAISIPDELVRGEEKDPVCTIDEGDIETHQVPIVEIDYKSVLEGFCNEKRAGHVSQSTITQYVYSMNTVFELLGIQNMKAVTRSDVIRVINLLFNYPKDARSERNKGFFDGLSVLEISEKNQTLNLPAIDRTTVSRYIQRCSSVYKWAVQHISEVTYNPFEGAIGRDNGKKHSQKKAKEDKIPFNSDDVETIFSHKVFKTGIVGYNTRDKLRLNYQYWVPLICLFSGLRPTECCQLRIENIMFEDGIMYFDITDKHKRQNLKNKNSVRKIPVHDELLNLGLEGYISSVNSEWLFPELADDEDTGFYSKMESWFTDQFTKKLDLTKQNKSFYSMRHTFISFYQKMNMFNPIVKQMTAHANKNVGDERYGEKFSVNLLKEHLDPYHSDIVSDIVKPWVCKG